MGFFTSKKKYKTVSVLDPSVRMCFKRGFMPIGDVKYIDEVMADASGLNKFIIIPEIEEISRELIDDIILSFDEYYDENGDLPGIMLQNTSSWIFAWGLEMGWRWVKGNLDGIVFQQDMNTFDVPMSKFALMPQPWYENLIDTFMLWSYNNPGYTEKYELDIYDPLRDGYLTMIRCAITKVMPQI